MTAIKNNLTHPRDIEYYGYLSHAEFEKLFISLSFLWNVRNQLHLLSGRKCDQLYFEYQGNLAERLAFKRASGLESVEAFLGTLHSHMEFIKQHCLIFRHEMKRARKKKRSFIVKVAEMYRP